VDRIAEAQRQTLDLSPVRLAYCGSEPIDHRVLDRFAELFRPAGFNAKAFYPCYGMAEATLLVTGSVAGAGADTLALDVEALAQGRAESAPAGGARVLVGCGYSMPGQDLRIVDPDTRRELPEGQVGEVWLRGPHVARGYWRKPELSAELFGACLADSGAGPYLRTGDLAFLRGGNLYVAGRSKDVIIVRGRNYYPQDLERSVAASHPALQPESGAAFSVEVGGEPKIVLAHEVRRTALRELRPEEVASEMRRAVFDQHELAVHALVLLKPATLPKTSSGKIRRGACRAAYLDGSLEAVYAWSQPAIADAPPTHQEDTPMFHSQNGESPGGAPGHDAGSRQRADEAIAWLRGYAESRVDSRIIDERRCIPPYIVLDFGNRGLLGLQAPVEVGGLGLSHRDAYRVLEQLAAIDTTLVSFVGVHNALGLRPLIRFGSDAQKRALLPQVARGRELASFGFTEPAAGSNPTAIESVAIPDGQGGWRLRGEKKWIGTAAWAGYVHVFAHVLDEQGRRRGLAGFTVRQGAPGFVQGPEELTMGMRGMVQNTIYLRDVAVGPEDMLGGPGQGMAIAQDIMESGRVGIAAVALGVMKRSAQIMARYAARRTMATGRLIDNIVSRDRLTQLAVEIDALEALLYAFADWLDEGRDVPKEYYAAIKVLAAEAAFRGVDQMMQMLGARGYIETNLAPQMLRDARLLRIFEGPSETMQMFVGSRLAAGSPAFMAFLREVLGAGGLAGELEDAALALKSRALADTRDGEDNWQDGQRIAQLLGGVGAWALWLAVVELEPSGGKLARARAWLRQRYGQCLAEAQNAQPGASAPLSSAEIEAAVAAYAGQIGDVQQYRPAPLEALDPLLRREASVSAEGVAAAPAQVPPAVPARAGELPESRAIEQWMQQWIAARMGQDRAEIAATKPFADFGLDSLTAMELTEQLEKWLGLPISPTATWDFPNIRLLAAHLAAEQRGTESAQAAPAARAEASDAAALDGLSDSELASLLAGELGNQS
jgi:alkylation response protein AidB-like acyl-CoA dehydrogenase/acyl carrier protein